MVGSAPPLMGLPTFVSLERFVPGQTVTLGEDDAHHMKVRRLELGSRVALVDGAGTRGEGTLVRLAKRHAAVLVEGTSTEAPPPAVHLVLPIADRDRMLWLAEKTAEIGVSSWRPVSFRRSKSVSPRGEGTVFTQKVAARMASALEQSGGSWLPTIYPASKLDRAIAASPTGVRLVLEQGGAPIERALDEAFRAIAARHGVAKALAPVTLVVGPEGGLEPDELKDLEAGGFAAAALGRTVLRFETAAIAALAVVRAAIDSRMAGAPAPKTMGDDDDG